MFRSTSPTVGVERDAVSIVCPDAAFDWLAGERVLLTTCVRSPGLSLSDGVSELKKKKKTTAGCAFRSKMFQSNGIHVDKN